MINRIEHFVTTLINKFLLQGYKTEIYLNNYNNVNISDLYENKNFDTWDNDILSSPFDKLCYARLSSRKRFASFLYVLAEVHELFLSRYYCTFRQLYYRNINVACNAKQLQYALKDVCQTLDTTSWNLGIFAAGKCFISGPLLVHMTNGDIIDCNEFKGATLLPSNFTHIDKFETRAKYALIIEKNTVFQNLIASDFLSILSGDIILVTARGYPDICTRWILHKLWKDNFLSIYAFVDADPFGIEIMLIYRYGPMTQGVNTYGLTCPQLRWLGIHPSDIIHMSARTEHLSNHDHMKIKSLLRRTYLDDDTRRELKILQRLQCKLKIDNISPNAYSTCVIEYIINKIYKRILL